jgi:hypothetical protein
MMTDPLIADLWEKARFGLKAHLDQRSVDAVFLEGSIAEGLGNERSDVDFVAIIDDASQLPATPYILFIDGRRIEVQLLSPAKLRRELRQVRAAVSKGLSAVAGLSWNLLERCQRFMGALPIHNGVLIGTLQGELGQQLLGDAVALRFEVRLLGLDDETIASIRSVEQGAIEACEEARNQLEVAEEIVQRLRRLSSEGQFPASFDTASGWHGTMLAAHDWINLGAHLGVRFPRTTHGGRVGFLPAVA